MAFHYECSACGAKFSTAINEARHRHNFPALCKRNKRFKLWERQRSLDRIADLLERYENVASIALPQFNWAKSALDGAAIAALNGLPSGGRVRKIIEQLRKGEIWFT